MKSPLLALICPLVLIACERSTTSFDANPPTTESPAPETISDAASPRHVSVSGLSSGAFMASQLHIAYGDIVDGVGMVAGGPYNCAAGQLTRALGACVNGRSLDTEMLLDALAVAEQSGDIAALDGLKDDRAWLLHGTNDTVVAIGVSESARDLYTTLLGDASAVQFVNDIPAAHGMPALGSATECAVMAAPFINDCGYDAAGEMLQHLTGKNADVSGNAAGVLATFEQPAAKGLASNGYVYTPSQCQDEHDCGVHLALHGCSQGAEFVGDAFARQAGYNRWADAIDLIVVYPQIESQPLLNPLGCWDWWGYTGSEYSTRDGKQVRALYELIQRYSGIAR